ncbi:MAG: DUF2232 domain-containing protein [Fibrobacteres bacterium]|nr:DUF2232 domain-containing protein [Fibrobacterota bacterium]
MIPLFLIPVIVAFLLVRAPKILGIFASVAVLAVVYKLKGLNSIEFLYYSVNGVVLGWFFAFAVIRKKSLFAIAVTAVVFELLIQVVVGTIPQYEAVYRKVLDTAAESVSSLFAMPELSQAMINFQWKILVPFSETLKSAIYALVLGIVLHRFAYGERRKLSEFNMPYWSVWVLAAALALAIFSGGSRNGNLLLLGMTVLYLVNGVSLVRLFFAQPGRSRVGEVLFFLMQIWLLFLPILFLGLMEYWMDLRGKLVRVQEK